MTASARNNGAYIAFERPSITMLSDFLQDQASLYVSGAMTEPQRADFDVLLEYHDELRAFTAELAEAGTRIMLTKRPPVLMPPHTLKMRVASLIQQRAQQQGPEARVVCGADGHIEWVNSAFTAMCGHSLSELKGKKPGSLLQGPATDPVAVERMRRAVHQQQGCTETILNYHKNGDAYWVHITLSPIKDDSGRLLWFLAREHELKSRRAVAVGL